jgi:hypothetical protein
MNSESSSKAMKPGRLECEQVAQLESRIRGYLIRADDEARHGNPSMIAPLR